MARPKPAPTYDNTITDDWFSMESSLLDLTSEILRNEVMIFLDDLSLFALQWTSRSLRALVLSVPIARHIRKRDACSYAVALGTILLVFWLGFELGRFGISRLG